MAKEKLYLLLATDLLALQSITSRSCTSATSAQTHHHFITGAEAIMLLFLTLLGLDGLRRGLVSVVRSAFKPILSVVPLADSDRSFNSSRSTSRLRVFLFPINPPPPSPALLELKQEQPSLSPLLVCPLLKRCSDLDLNPLRRPLALLTTPTPLLLQPPPRVATAAVLTATLRLRFAPLRPPPLSRPPHVTLPRPAIGLCVSSPSPAPPPSPRPPLVSESQNTSPNRRD